MAYRDDMTRRSFFARTVGACLAAIVAPALAPIVRWKSRLWVSPMYPIEDVQWAPPMTDANTVYFLNHDGPWRITSDGPARLWTAHTDEHG